MSSPNSGVVFFIIKFLHWMGAALAAPNQVFCSVNKQGVVGLFRLSVVPGKLALVLSPHASLSHPAQDSLAL